MTTLLLAELRLASMAEEHAVAVALDHVVGHGDAADLVVHVDALRLAQLVVTRGVAQQAAEILDAVSR
jgi:hypothetical protein